MSENTPKKSPLKFAVAGAGMLFNNGYSRWLGNFLSINKQRYTLCAICDPDEKTALRHTSKFGARHYSDFSEMLHAEQPAAVVINTPHWLHEEQTLMAAAAGASVLCEKPMAPTSAACRKMLETCNSAGTHLQIGFMRRFIPGFQQIRSLIADGSLGKILDIEIDWPYFIPDITTTPFREIIDGIETISGIDLPAKFGAWRLKDKRSGGGIFLDHAPHLIDLFRFWNGEISGVTALTHSSLPDENDDYARCVVRFENRSLGFITTTLRDPKGALLGQIKGFIRGDKGSIGFTLPNPTHFAGLKKIDLYKEPSAPAGRLTFLAGIRKKELTFPHYNAFRDQLEYFLSTCAGARRPHKLFGTEPFAAYGDDGLRATEIVEAAYKSSASGIEWRNVYSDYRNTY